MPNLQFLVNAAKAIYTLMDQKGWDADLAARALDYLQRPSARTARVRRSLRPATCMSRWPRNTASRLDNA